MAAPASDLPPPADWNAEGYRRHAGFVADLAGPVVGMLAPVRGERILDLGCGDGVLTAALAALGAEVVGVDASPDMVAAARARGLDARVLDGQALADPTPDVESLLGDAGKRRGFDAVFSNAALHWMPRPDAVIAGVARLLRPGGRFVGEFGAAGNVARIGEALVAGLDRRGLDGRAAWPWYFPEPDDYRARLVAGGFRVVGLERFDRPTPLPTGLAGWLVTFAGPFLRHLPAAEHDAYLAEVAEAVAPTLRDGSGHWWADYVRLRFAAIKPD
jgi:SAM-dependent methyltransferase